MIKNKQNYVIIVNEKDEWLGYVEKMQAHKEGLLHRAFSVFVMNNNNEILLQRRALDKYHSGGLWSNTCCSHPWVGESTMAAAHRRLVEEMGFDCELEKLFTHKYKLGMDNGLFEHEYDHVYFGVYNGDLDINKDEVAEYKFVPINELDCWLEKRPMDFTAWFRLLWPEYCKQYLMSAKVA
ncbi:MAG: isopentenyl-diphosphate Delta-isomerase [Chitinophagaceae bacterium]|nr:isopentenyl-diphosphate Delta-isomerase [Chitinophagaceae bacterium]